LIFVDSNIPMYLVGAEHSNKHRAQLILQTAVAQNERLVTDVEVLQEIMHRYAAIARLDAVQPAFDALLGVVDEVFSGRCAGPRPREGRAPRRDVVHRP
jgi:predicted nucleic acid-binding protein